MVSDTIHPVNLLSYRFSFPYPKARRVGYFVPIGKKRWDELFCVSCLYLRMAQFFGVDLGAIFLSACRVLHPG